MFLPCSMKLLLNCIVLVALLISANAQDYCDQDLCRGAGTHIGCHTSNNFGPECPLDGTEVIRLTPARKAAILKLHNTKRSMIASGQLKGFGKAAQMPQLQWDEQLAYLAQLNAKKCVLAHDECHNTQTYKLSGQNLALTTGLHNSSIINIDNEIEKNINQWFDEYKSAHTSDIDSFDNRGKLIFEFLTMVNDRITKVGCGMTKFTDKNNPDTKELLMVCNYSFTNVAGEPVYETHSTACARCQTGCSKVFPGLCLVDENLFITPYDGVVRYKH